MNKNEFDNIFSLLSNLGLASPPPNEGPCPCGCESDPFHERAFRDAAEASVADLCAARDAAEEALSRFLGVCERHEQALAYYETVRTSKELSKFFGRNLTDASHILADVRNYIKSRGMVLPIKMVEVAQKCDPKPAPVVAPAAKPAAKPAAAVKRVVVTSPAKKK